MVSEKTLDQKVTEACHRIEELYYETDGKCYISYSGGKDSTVLLALVKLCEEVYTIPENGIPAVFVNTGIEMGVTIDFVKWVKENYYQNLITIRPSVSFDWVLKTCGKPIKSKMKSEMLDRWQKGSRTDYVIRRMIYGKSKDGASFERTKIADKDAHMISDDFAIHASNKCCDYLKKRPFAKYAKENNSGGFAIGIRMVEQGAREIATKKRLSKGGRVCSYVSHGIIKKAPIIDWADEDVDEFVKKYNVPLSRAYTEYGFHRTGCMACPYAFKWLPNDLKYLHDHEPNRYKAAMHWLKDVYIAQNVILPFDEDYENERIKTWFEVYEPMRQEMLRKYRPNSKLIKTEEQINIFDLL